MNRRHMNGFKIGKTGYEVTNIQSERKKSGSFYHMTIKGPKGGSHKLDFILMKNIPELKKYLIKKYTIGNKLVKSVEKLKVKLDKINKVDVKLGWQETKQGDYYDLSKEGNIYYAQFTATSQFKFMSIIDSIKHDNKLLNHKFDIYRQQGEIFVMKITEK